MRTLRHTTAPQQAPVADIAERVVTDWDVRMAARRDFDEAWLFRGQPDAWPLVTSLERACELFDVRPDAVRRSAGGRCPCSRR